MTFEAYLENKKIDPAKFKKGEIDRYDAFKMQFDQMHPKSFTAQKLYLINGLRRRYPLHESNPNKNILNKSVTKPKIPIKRK